MGIRLLPRPESTALAATVDDAIANPGRVVLSKLHARTGILDTAIDTEGRGITAAAAVMAGGKVKNTKTRIPVQAWQREVWQHRRETPELRFSGDRVARALSRVKFFIAEIPEPGAEPKPVESSSELGILSAELFSECSQQIRRFGQHLVYAGESLLHFTQDQESGDIAWQPYSTTECTGGGRKWEINDGSGVVQKVDPDNDLLVRAWTKDPERGYLAESPVQAILPIARELKALTQRVAAEIDSRLAGNGLLLVPSEIEVLKGQASKGKDVDDFVQALLEMMLTPIKDQASASAVVPLVAKVPAAMIDKIQHLTFSSDLDPRTKEMRDEAIRRIALGMDSDPSVLLGMGEGSNHWQAWLIAEDEVKLVISPAAETFCHAVYAGATGPMVKSLGYDPSKYTVWYDAAELELRPDKSKDSRELHALGLLTDEVVVKEHGFAPSDIPEQAVRDLMLLRKMLEGNGSLAPLLLPLLGINVDPSVLNKASDINQATGAGTPNTFEEPGGEGDNEPSGPANPIPEKPDEPEPKDGI